MLIYKLRRLAAVLFFRARFIHVLGGVMSYALVAYLLLYFAGEQSLLTGENFANRIIIDTPSDDVTLAIALFCQNSSPESHKTVYFQDDSLAALLKLHCPGVEVIPSVSVEMLARSTSDPGSGLLHKQLLDSTYGTTSYCITFEGGTVRNFDALFQFFRSDLSATLLGVKPLGSDEIALNPYGISVAKGDVLYYIAPHRLSEKQCFSIASA